MKKERKIEKIYSLTPMQEGMLFHALKDTETNFYCEQYLFTLKGKIDKDILEESFNRLIKRHDILRSFFVYDKIKKPKQVVVDGLSLEIPVEDISHMEEDEQERYLEEFKIKDRTRGFDLSGELLMRVFLFILGPGTYKLLWSSHHITMDGWSSGVFITEMIRLYRALRRREAVRLMPVVPFRNYIKWLEKQDKEKGLKYWTHYLDGYRQRTTLPKWGPPLPGERHRTEEYRFSLGEALSGSLTRLAADCRVTVGVVIQAIWGLLLQRYNNTDDVVFGVVVSGRPPEIDGIETMIGLFINAVPVRVKSRPRQSFTQLLEDVREKAAASKSFEYLPLADVQNLSELRRELIDHLITFENYPLEEQMKEAGAPGDIGFKIEDVRLSDPINYDLGIMVLPGVSLIVNFTFNSTVYPLDLIRAVGRHFEQLIARVTAEPGVRIGDIDILTREEKDRLLSDFNAAAADYPRGKTIHELFEEQVARTPDGIAGVDMEGRSLTYRVLNGDADRLAVYLHLEKGVGPGESVGILMERGLHYVIALLGVLKAGGAYVPIDTALPYRRIKHIVNDARIRVVVSTKRHVRSLNRLQWECSSLGSFLCVDSVDIRGEVEHEKNRLMDKNLWEYIGEKASDEIEGGGWNSSYTGEPFKKVEMDEYGDNILKKLTPLLHKGMRVLEIGCASGISLFRIAPRVGFYYGTDLSEVIIRKNRLRAEEEGYRNIAFKSLAAHEIDDIHGVGEGNFDLVIINSVIQAFHGHNYLRDVIEKSIDLLNDKGYLFIGDVMDQDLKEQMVREMWEFKQANRGKGYRTKTDFSSELFVSRLFFEDLREEYNSVCSVTFSDKIHTVTNELTRFRYDVLITIDKHATGDGKTGKKNKYQDDLSTLRKYDGKKPETLVSPEDPAYVIYTSGTTGVPKGVLVRHRGMVNLVHSHRGLFGEGPGDRFSQVSSPGFDAMGLDAWPCLLSGAALHIAVGDVRANPSAMKEWLLRNRVTISFQPTVMAEALLELHWPEQGTALRFLRTGGDRLKKYPTSCYPFRFFNLYGPTEDSVCTTWTEVRTAARGEMEGCPSIGKPIDNHRVYILSSDLALQPIGVPGDLYISGEGLAIGYLNNPELTAERFPPAGGPSLNKSYKSYRTYKTGDLARWLPDGNIEFLGRIDHQVKIRGFRIETGEIESKLLKHETVREAVVTGKETEAHEKYLCAYIVPVPGMGAPDFVELREYLSLHLPDYMIPSHFIQLECIPLMSNGKIDRQALPDPGITAGADFFAPANDVEKKLVEIWSRILNISRDKISVNSDFFRLGGHSLKATMLVSEIHKELNVKLPLAKIFETPQIRGLAAYMGYAVEDEYAFLEPAETKEYYRLSSPQKRLYVLQQLDLENTGYHMAGSIQLKKDVDVKRLEGTFRKLIARHESLRTSFLLVDNQPVQKVHKVEEVGDNWSLVTGESDTGEAGGIFDEFFRPFDLSRAPLLRAGLIKSGDRGYTLLFVLHHIISDGISQVVLSREFQSLYEGEELPPLRLQYKDYAEWCASGPRRALIKEQEAYWLTLFAEEVPVLDLPADYPRPGIQSFEGSRIEFILNEKESRTLNVLARETGATLYISILSVFTVLLSRLSGREDIVVGTPVAARRHADLEKIIGMFVNTLALRNHVPAEATYKEFVKELKDRTLKAYENQEYPFETLVEKINVVRDISRNPVFDVVFNLINIEDYTHYSTTIDPGNSNHYPYVEETSKFDLTLAAVDFGERVHLSFEYCTLLFKPATIERFISYFRKIVEELTVNIDQNLSKIEIIPRGERERLLYEFNNTRVDYPREKTIHELFAEQAERTPDGIALAGADPRVHPNCLTYRELKKKSDGLAGSLIGKGVRADNIVGVKAERSVEMVIGIMGILKSGAAYLPIDPDFPRERIDYMLEDSGAKIVLSASSADIEVIGQPPIHTSTPRDLAYIIYTSGTTGKPKGVLIEHRNVVRLLFNDGFQFDFNERDVWSLFHSSGFDFSVWEMFGALLYGGRLVVIPKMTARDPRRFLDVLINQKVTVLNQTPSAFYNLIDEELKNNGNDLCLRYVIFGGEALKPARLKAWWKKYPGTTLVNMFGITETCVHVTYKEIGEIEIEGDIGNIGKPIPTLGTYIMDGYRGLAPTGTPGELYVGGEGVARGYLNRPELTSDRFVENPYQAGERLYRSGDLARICAACPAADLVYLGRMDHQVQLRGFRIELGEIESRLLKHEAIKEAVVVEGRVSSGDLYLCAYIVPRPGEHAAELETASIREFLARQLPDYMIPSYVVRLEHIPLTSNGKIDRKKLPQPEVKIERDRKPPRNKTEETLADAWKGVLGLETVGIDDNFFDVGGDSIKAIRLISKINESLNGNLKIVDLYTNRTVGELAGLIDREEPGSVQDLYRKITTDFEELKKRVFERMKEQGTWDPDEIEDIYPMSEIEKGMVFSYMKYAGTGIYHDQFVYPLYYKDFDIERFKKTLTLVVRKHEILRTGFNLDEFEEPVQVVYKEPGFDPAYTDLSGLAPDKQFDRVEEWLSEDRGNPFDAPKYPLWRVQVFNLGNDRLFLLLTVHHAILDGWSNSILMTDLHNIYFELEKNPSYVPVKLKAGYKDTVIEERIEKENTRAARYWKEELRDYIRLEFSETLKNKGELEPMKVFAYNAGTEILERAKQAAVLWNTAVKNLFFSAYAFTMRMFSYENDMVLGCVTHNRPGKTDGDNILGCFLNTTPVRLKIPASLSWKEYAVMVERKMLEVKRYERLPLFEIALIIGEKSKDRNPIFDTLFNFTDFHIYRQAGLIESGSGSGSGSGIDREIGNSRIIEGQFDTNTLFDFEVDITTGSLSIHPKYNAQVIGDNMVKKCCTYFVNILEKYISDPDGPARRDDIMPVEEKEDLLHRFNDTRAPYSREKTMPVLFEEQALKTPDNTAVIDADGLSLLTYRELNEQANRLAGGLRKMGIETGDFVGVVMERRMEMVLAVMAILKAGGAYVPFEPYLPDRRIEKILESLKTKCVFADSSTRPRLEAMGASSAHLNHIVCPGNTGYKEFKDNPVENPAPASGPEDISYVIYTSGSTGTPKGVVETHRPVVNVVEWVNKTFGVGETDKLLFVASLGFDLSVYDIFGILSSGGSIRTAGPGDMKEPLRLLEILVKEGITFWDSAPAALQRLVPFFSEVREEGKMTALRLVFLSGDWIPVSMPDALKDTFIGVRVISLGGATEATIWSNYYPIGDVDPSWPSIPYGKPIQNAAYYILDSNLELCPVKIAGDLYIGGECLAKEYKNDPGLTAGKFIENPFRPGERMYKTGDIARWFEDGNMQFLGRKDHQVKIRGYRIELGEIESQLSGYPGIRETIAIDREDGSGNKYICAYYTLERTGEKIEKEELISYLSGELPEYMIPSYFIAIDRVPVTANGKLDRSALPGPELNTAAVSYAAPGDELQETLLGIWKDVLFGAGEAKVQIGIDDDFFELGGHSLNATLVISKIHKAANVKVPLAEMFRRPTVRELSEVIKKSGKEIYAGINAVEKKEYYRLSSAQKRLFILQRMDMDGTAYNMPETILIPGASDLGKIEKTFKELIKRHESLRTSFHMIDDSPVQKVHEHVEFQIEQLGAGDPGDFIRPFDLSQAPLLRAGVARSAGNTHLLIVDVHHIVSDGVSHQVLVKEYRTLYNGGSLSPLRIQYKDFSEWQNGEREKENLKRREEYWLNEFTGEIPVLDLPNDHPRPAVQSFEGDVVDFEISAGETRALTAATLKESATLFMGLTAVFNILLSKLGGREEIIVGTPVAGRRHTDLEKIIGMFVNTLPLRNYPAGNQTFAGFLGKVKERVLSAFENQEYPFEELVDKLSVRRDMGRNPLFDVMLVLQNMNTDFEADLPAKIDFPKEYENIVRTAKFDLTLTAVERNRGLFLSFQYCTKLFKRETVERFVDYFKKIVSITMKDPGIRLSEIEIITGEEKKRILSDFNDTRREYPRDKTIHRLFEEQVEKTPHRTALLGDGGMHLSYRELNERSCELAGLLIEKGVLAGGIVGIMKKRSVEMIIGIFGILKAGGAYMPIDPGYPRERIDYMLKDSGTNILIDETFFGGPGGAVLQKKTTVDADLAYIIYTSGSTGRPKGVMVQHRAVVNRLNWMQRVYPINENDVLIQKTPVTFDVSVWELFWWSFYGSSLFVPAPGVQKNPEALVRAIQRYRVTTIHFVPSMLNLWLDHINNERELERLLSLRQVFSSGEALDVYHVVKFDNTLGKTGHTGLINLYGPTEACVDVSYFNCRPPAEQNLERVPIGKPIDNIRLYVVSEGAVLQPIGVAGELLIAGVGLAVGYLNNPGLTAERFFNRSYQTYKSYKTYKTGDLARWLPDGSIEFLGRMDHQVKIRGFRIEMGEIEHQLLKHRAVKEAVVIAREERGEKYLCAYITACETTSAELREYLAGTLPDYMVPSFFVFLDKFPLNASGKMDRKALPLPEITPGPGHVGPRDRVEETFAEIWSEVLGINKENIGIDSNFFQLGGHSLKAVALLTRSHRVFNVKIPLTTMFKNPTIRYLAEYVKTEAEETFLSIPAAEKREYYPLSPAQKRMYILQQVQLQGTGYNIPGVVLLDGLLDAERLETVFHRLIERHESLRTSFDMINEEPVQMVHDHPVFNVERLSKAAVHDFIRPFDLSRAPLIRVGLAPVEDGKHVLMLDMHHIVTDGASLGILIKEFVELYHGRELSPPRIDYKDYALWRTGGERQEAVKEMEAYWLSVFSGEVPPLDLPIDHPRPPRKRFDGGECRFTLDAGETRVLKDAAKAAGATMYMSLLTVYYIVLSKLGGREDIVVGTPTAGRHHDDIRQTVGMFVNTLALRNRPSGEKSVNAFLAEVKQRTLEAFEHQEYPFEELVDRLDIPRDTGRNPLFDVMFNLQNTEVEARELPNLTVTPMDIEGGISKFDMTLTAAESGENLEFSIAYAAALFDPATVERFAGYFKTAVSAVIRDPGQTISQIDIIPPAEREMLLHVFNDAHADYPAHKTLHRLFEERAARCGDRVAVIADGAITYGELNKRADLLARVLRRKGAASGNTAAVVGERSVETVIGILAILKAGGAYLPLDPQYPEERIRYMLEDSGAEILVTTRNKGCREQACLFLDVDTCVDSNPRDLAYIIYTSGSTGRPRGVMVSHRSVVNLVYALERRVYPRQSPVNVAMAAPFTFDASVKQLFPALLLGHSLVIVPEDARLDGLKLIRFYKKNAVALSDATPAHLDIIAESAAAAGSMEDFPVRRFLVGGEELERSTAERFINTTGVEDIVNVYGPTECCDVTTTFTVTRDILDALERIPLGKPLNNVNTVVLGPAGELRPMGVPGELVIAGDGVARGYLNDPELTAERFGKNRTYKTGDLGRHLPDGNIQFLGRMDNQVKVRGFRIEPAEIEGRLRRYEGTREAVVVAREKNGETYLCAYVVPRGTVFDDSACRDYLSRHLPGYMVPLHIVPLEKLPLTAAGKIHRDALPEPGISAGGTYVPPTGEIEEKLVEIWAEVLGIEEDIVGIDDDFFRLGGHSLKATVMVRKIHKEFNIEISLGDVFKTPTVRGIASIIGAVELVCRPGRSSAAEIEEILL